MIRQKKVLYIVFNDGSDTRVKRTLKLLGKRAEFIDVALLSNSTNIPDNTGTVRYFRIKRSHKSIAGILLFNMLIMKLRLQTKYDLFYVVDEQCYMVTFLSLLFRPRVLDVFDSIFLKLNVEAHSWIRVKSLLYKQFNLLVVTDDTRLSLLPNQFLTQAVVLPNTYELCDFPEKRTTLKGEGNVFALIGSLTEARGVSVARSILSLDPNAKIVMAGWLYDQAAEALRSEKRVFYHGVLDFKDTHNLLKQADFLISVYPETNLNNKYASPNKIYDSILCSIPLVINKYPIVAQYVERINIGAVIESSLAINSAELDLLYENNFSYIDSLRELDRDKFSLDHYAVEYIDRIFL